MRRREWAQRAENWPLMTSRPPVVGAAQGFVSRRTRCKPKTQAAAHWLWHEGISATRFRGAPSLYRRCQGRRPQGRGFGCHRDREAFQDRAGFRLSRAGVGRMSSRGHLRLPSPSRSSSRGERSSQRMIRTPPLGLPLFHMYSYLIYGLDKRR
jgi:hypothetical protein